MTLCLGRRRLLWTNVAMIRRALMGSYELWPSWKHSTLYTERGSGDETHQVGEHSCACAKKKFDSTRSISTRD